MLPNRILLLAMLIIMHSEFLKGVEFHVIKQWNYLNYTWPTSESFNTSTVTGNYIPENIIIAGVVYFEDWLYLTMPRMKPGVPITLGRISAKEENDTAPLIDPYPSWEFNTVGNCEALQNVQNIEIGITGEMWIIDGGHTASLTPTPVKNCPPKLIIFNIKLNTTTFIHIFPQSAASRTASFLYDLVVDGDFAYITDNSRYDPGIIVVSRKSNHSWKIRNSRTMNMHFNALTHNFTVSGVPISSPLNIAGIALEPPIFCNNSDNELVESRRIFYCSLSGLNLYAVSTSILKNENDSKKELSYPGEIQDLGQKASQTDGMVMTNKGVLYYGLLADNSIAKWDSSMPFDSATKVSKDTKYIQWTNSFTIDLQGNLIVLTNNLQKFIRHSLDVNEPNFWLLSAPIGENNYLYSDSSNNSSTSVKKKSQPFSERCNMTSVTARHVLTKNTSSTTGQNEVIRNLWFLGFVLFTIFL